jgi:hypothetical protein
LQRPAGGKTGAVASANAALAARWAPGGPAIVDPT